MSYLMSYSCCAEYTKSHGQSTSQPGPVLPSPRIHLSTKAAVLTPCFETLYLDVTVHCLSAWLDLRRKRKKMSDRFAQSLCQRLSVSLSVWRTRRYALPRTPICSCRNVAELHASLRVTVRPRVWRARRLKSEVHNINWAYKKKKKEKKKEAKTDMQHCRDVLITGNDSRMHHQEMFRLLE